MSILIKGTNIEDLQRAMLMFSGHEIVELPNHGDLIDRDALEHEFICLSNDEWNKKTGTSWARAFEEAADVVYNAPAVIPAERSEE